MVEIGGSPEEVERRYDVQRPAFWGRILVHDSVIVSATTKSAG